MKLKRTTRIRIFNRFIAPPLGLIEALLRAVQRPFKALFNGKEKSWPSV
ncbi:MAG: hypothetical protein HQL35_04815 [Alphaproteobacteria bacterium]|nr:hypothetical protein [Alphaproteobacteria bacterium]